MKTVLTLTLGVCAVGMAGWFANAPVDGGVKVEGRISQACVSVSRQNNRLRCTAELSDGTVQVFDSFQPAAVGSPVVFVRKQRRYFGHAYFRLST